MPPGVSASFADGLADLDYTEQSRQNQRKAGCPRPVAACILSSEPAGKSCCLTKPNVHVSSA